MKTRLLLVACALPFVVTACATSSKNIAPAYVSPLAYQNFTCEQLSAEAQRIAARVQQVSGTADSNASNDAVATGVGVVLFWPALFFIEGDGEITAELSRLKGEYEAVNQAGISKNCPGLVRQPPPPAPVAAPAEAKPKAPK